MSRQAENAQAGAAAMARATYSRKAGEHESNKQSRLNEIRVSVASMSTHAAVIEAFRLEKQRIAQEIKGLIR